MKVFFGNIGTLFKRQSGYTLTELSISTSIIAMLAVGGLAVLEKKNDSAKYKETNIKINAIDEALKIFIKTNNYIPCPADPTLIESNASFGVATSYNTTSKICSSVTNETGAVPVKILGLPDDYSYDGWGRKFMYRAASSSGSTSDFTSPSFRGNIAVVDLKGTHKTSINEPSPYDDGAIYVVISYGANGKNVAYRKNNTTTPSAASGIEAKNTSHSGNVYIQNEKTSVFDDIVIFGTSARLHNIKVTESPIKIDDITCQTAQSVVKGGRTANTFNSYATTSSSAYSGRADTIYKSAQVIADLCKNRQAAETVSPERFNGLKLWLDAADNATLFNNTNCTSSMITANNTPVKCWKDKSGNNNNATQSTGETTYKTNIVNGKPVLRFSQDSPFNMPTSLLSSITSNVTVFIAAGINDTGINLILVGSPDSSTNRFNIHLPIYSSIIYWDFGNISTGGRMGASWGASFGTHYIWGFNSSGTTSKNIWRNGSLIATSTSSQIPNYGTNTGLTLGNNLSGDVDEILIYNTTLSESERQKVEEYLSNKWGITLDTSTSTCDAGMTFQKTASDPAGSCKCPSGQQLLADLKTSNACYVSPTATVFGKCVDVISKPTYSSSPQTNNMVLWLDANDCTTLTLSGSGTDAYVDTWKDKSPSGVSATQSTTSNKPLYLKNTINGMPVLRFDGTNDYLSGTVTLSPTASNISLSAFIAAKFRSASYPLHKILFSINAGSVGIGYHASAPSSYNAFQWGAHESRYNTSSSINTNFHIFSAIRNNTTNKFSMFMDGNLGTASCCTPTSSSLDTESFHIGALDNTQWFAQADIGEIILYNTVLSNKERTDIENYLSYKWGVVRKPSDVERPDINTSSGILKLWLDASDTTTLFTDSSCGPSYTARPSDKIGCWQDKSGNGYHAIQTEDIFKPLYTFGTATTSTASGGNNIPAIQFDGINDYLNNTTFSLTTTPSIFAVAYTGSATGYKSIINNDRNFFLGTGSTSNASNIYFASFYGYAFGWGTTSDHGTNSTGSSALISSTSPAPYYAFTSINDGTNDNAYLNGTLLNVRANTMNALNNEGYRVGAQQYAVSQLWDGGIGEIIIYNSVLSDTNRAAVEGYLKNKWGI